MFMRRPFVSALLLTAAFAVSACTAILVPDGDIERCNNTSDCEQPDDNRWAAVCVSGEGQAANSDQVCAPRFVDNISCGINSFEGDHPVAVLYDDVTDNESKALYGACSGSIGCAPPCESGLEPNVFGVCDDPEAALPAVYPPDVGGIEIAGQDVLDQFCRSFFCDESFVCDTSLTNPTCKPCTDTDDVNDFGAGGCGLLHVQGALSPVYTSIDPDQDSCGSKQREDVDLGVAPEP